MTVSQKHLGMRDIVHILLDAKAPEHLVRVTDSITIQITDNDTTNSVLFYSFV